MSEGITVLSLFDGMSCGRIALDKLGIKVKDYYASEIDKYAIQVSNHNYPEIIHIGDVTKVSYKDGVLTTENGEYIVGKIDLLIAGSPCQGFSLVGKQLAFDDDRSKLYFEFERIKNETAPQHWLLENVKMRQEFKDIISSRLRCCATKINSELVTAQRRPRLYWSSLGMIRQPTKIDIFLKDILQHSVDSKYFLSEKAKRYVTSPKRLAKKFTSIDGEKALCLMAGYERLNGTFIADCNGNRASINDCTTKTGTLLSRYSKGATSYGSTPFVMTRLDESLDIRRLTPVECERLQTVPDNYTACVADTHRYKMLGNGWTVDVIAHIFSQMNLGAECETNI